MSSEDPNLLSAQDLYKLTMFTSKKLSLDAPIMYEGELEPVHLPMITEDTLNFGLSYLNIDGSYERDRSVNGWGSFEVDAPIKRRAQVGQQVYEQIGLIEQEEEIQEGFLAELDGWVNASFDTGLKRDAAAIGAAVILAAFNHQIGNFFKIIEEIPAVKWNETFAKTKLTPVQAKSFIQSNSKLGKIPSYQQNLNLLLEAFEKYISDDEEALAARRGTVGMYTALEDVWSDHIVPKL